MAEKNHELGKFSTIDSVTIFYLHVNTQEIILSCTLYFSLNLGGYRFKFATL